MSTPLPRDEDGFIETSAKYGEGWLVRITYNTDPDGNWVDFEDNSNETLHGPFDDQAEAMSWIEAYPDGDKDIKDMDIICFNRGRPVTA